MNQAEYFSGESMPPIQSKREITQLLELWRDGKENAFHNLFSLVYEDLRKMAHFKLQEWKSSHFLQTTALVHELYLKWFAAQKVPATDRHAIKRLAAHAMVQILIDHVRKYKNNQEIPTEDTFILESCRTTAENPSSIESRLTGDQALEQLTITHPEKAFLAHLKLKYGFTLAEIAEATGLHLSRIKRDWVFCKEFLTQHVVARSNANSE